MATQLQHLRDDVRLRLGLSSSDPQLTDANLNDVINAAFFQSDNLRNWWWNEEERTFNTAASTSDYAVAADWRKTVQLRLGDIELIFRPRGDVVRLADDTGEPRYYTIVTSSGSQYIRLFPQPEGVHTITETYQLMHTALSGDTDTTQWPDWAIDLPMLQAASIAAARVDQALVSPLQMELRRTYDALRDEVVPASTGLLPQRRTDWRV